MPISSILSLQELRNSKLACRKSNLGIPIEKEGGPAILCTHKLHYFF